MRAFTPYELNQLIKHNISNKNPDHYGDKPVEYITGFAEFYNRDFIVDQTVLIPRIETEQIIDLTIKEIEQHIPLRPVTILDIGTGSGCIGITLFLELQKRNITTHIHMTDVSENAWNICAKNINKHISSPYHHNFSFYKSDLMSNIPSQLSFDIIVSNLPYIPSARITNLEPGVKDFEPILALDGGEKGYEIIHQLLYQLYTKTSNKGIQPLYLKPTSEIILEIDDSHDVKDFEMFEGLKIELILDINEKHRFLVIRI